MAKKNVLLALNEWKMLRQSLDIITIQGKDARMVADLQNKLDKIITQDQPPV